MLLLLLITFIIIIIMMMMMMMMMGGGGGVVSGLQERDRGKLENGGYSEAIIYVPLTHRHFHL